MKRSDPAPDTKIEKLMQGEKDEKDKRGGKGGKAEKDEQQGRKGAGKGKGI